MSDHLVYDEKVKNPNQRRVEFKWRSTIFDGDEIGFDPYVVRNAAQRLDVGPFKLFMYLLSRQSDYILNLSQIAVERTFGIKKNQYYRAIEKLKEAGYLIQPDPAVKYYIFDEFNC